jgi:hypothetical protein
MSNFLLEIMLLQFLKILPFAPKYFPFEIHDSVPLNPPLKIPPL